MSPRVLDWLEMPNDAQAQAAINALNGKDLGGRDITVNVARPKTEGGRGGSRGGGFGGNRNRW